MGLSCALAASASSSALSASRCSSDASSRNSSLSSDEDADVSEGGGDGFLCTGGTTTPRPDGALGATTCSDDGAWYSCSSTDGLLCAMAAASMASAAALRARCPLPMVIDLCAGG